MTTHVFRTREDETLQGRPEGCPWPDANVFLGGRMQALEDDRVLGVARACALVTSELEPGVEVPFYAEFHFDAGDHYRAEGSARVLARDVPAPDVVLAGCVLQLVDGPEGFVGGVATSASVFNPLRRHGVETGSTWTLHAYLERSEPV